MVCVAAPCSFCVAMAHMVLSLGTNRVSVDIVVMACLLVGVGLLPKNPVNKDGFNMGFNNPITMANGYGFVRAKAHNESKLVLMTTSNFLQSKFHKSHNLTFSPSNPTLSGEGRMVLKVLTHFL